MPTLTLAITSYPTLQTITNLVRTDVRDDMKGATGTIGEGQILVDNMSISLTMANMFNSAVRDLARQLRLIEAPNLIVDNHIISGIPPLSGPQGLAVADPSVQVWIGFGGYFNGTTINSNWRLPGNLFEVDRCWERETSSNDTYCDMGEPAQGLAGVYQTSGFGRWEWRQDRVNLPGSLDTRDLRLRYKILLQAQFVATAPPATTYLPILDCEEAIARKIEVRYAMRQGGAMYAMAKAEEQEATHTFLNQHVHRQQGINYPTQAYGDEAPPVISYGI